MTGVEFSAGTKWAPRGLALAGENGPEFIVNRGGERIIPADQTARILKGSTTGSSVPPGSGVVITGGNFGYSPKEIAEEISRKQRAFVTMANLRAVG